MYGDGGYHGDWGWGGWLVMSLTMLAFLALVGWGVFLIWRATAHPPQAGPQRPESRPTAEEILAERVARGEIDVDEYRIRLDALKRGGA